MPSPYGESSFQINNTMYTIARSTGEFPSPYGELSFQIDYDNARTVAVFMFPSPYGELSFQIRERLYGQNYVIPTFRLLTENHHFKLFLSVTLWRI